MQLGRETGVPLLDTPGAGDDLRSNTIGTCEKSAFVAVATISPRRQRGEVSTHCLQDCSSVRRVERVGDVLGKGYSRRVSAMVMKPELSPRTSWLS